MGQRAVLLRLYLLMTNGGASETLQESDLALWLQ